jgi:very-short-patch-repair endonuclease
VVTTQQLRAIGFTYAAIVRWVAMGRLIRLHRGVYLVGRPPASRETLFHAAVLACGADAGLTGFAAAALCGFWNGQTSPIEVIAPREVRPRSGIRARQVTAMAPLTKRHGIPVTRPEATILYLAGEMYSDRHFRRLVHEALVQKVTSLSSLLAEVERAPRRTQAVERVERELADGAKPTRSGTEDELVELLRGGDFPRFDTCAHVPGTPDWMEVDVLFRAQRLVVEIDGELWHGTSYRREFDAYKDGILERAGFGVLRLGEDAVIPACQAETRDGIRHRLGLA